MSDELIALSASEAVEALRAGGLSGSELFEAYAARIESADGDLGAFLWRAEDVPAQDADSPLGGIPLAIKDLFCTQGVPTTAASRILEGYRPPYTATAVERLVSAGAPLLAKTHQDEFAMGSSTEAR